MFTYTYDAVLQRYKTQVKDRRNNNWLWSFTTIGTFVEFSNPYTQKKTFQYDLSRNRTHFTNELNKTWVATYDVRGNITTLTNPLNQKWAATYDTLNNLLTVKPPLNSSGGTDSSKQVTFEYQDYNTLNPPELGDPTHLTKITEPADGQGNPAVDTDISWHHPPLTGSPPDTHILRLSSMRKGLAYSFLALAVVLTATGIAGRAARIGIQTSRHGVVIGGLQEVAQFDGQVKYLLDDHGEYLKQRVQLGDRECVFGIRIGSAITVVPMFACAVAPLAIGILLLGTHKTSVRTADSLEPNVDKL